MARYFFIILTFAGLLSTGWFGIPLIPKYFVGQSTDLLAGTFTLFSFLGTVWGIMAYREFTSSVDMILEARIAARKLDPMIGDYEYRSYNPITREYEAGFVPSGPIDFWDKETQVPEWMDKGKYWHVLMSLQSGKRELKLKVVKDKDLPFNYGPMNVAVTRKVKLEVERKRDRYRYIVVIPQWLVMNTERKRFAWHDMPDSELSSLISDVNKKIVAASDDVAEWERMRIRYPWKVMTLGIYLNKSLPLRLVYTQVIGNLPGAKRHDLDETNANLANIKDDKLIASILKLASEKAIPPQRMEMLEILIRFLKNAYTRLGLGEGASEYHSFHHSLEVSYMALHMLPRQIEQFTFGPRDYEVVLVASLLHDYDPGQARVISSRDTPKGPNVIRTMDEVQRTRIVDAYFTMNREQFENYFRDLKSPLGPPVEFATTHPEYVKPEWSPTESAMVEALIWRTDFPFPKQKLSQEKFARALMELTSRGEDADRISALAELLWLADLAVTYMGSDPVRAWDRVTNLYDELNLPKLEAVAKTDQFFADFAENPLFRKTISMRYFPYIFRYRWNLIYRFFHEGNPSTQLNTTVASARKMYSKVNLELGMRKGELLQQMAQANWSEYFIGIGKDQSEVFKTKSRLAEMDPQNASALWGDSEKLLPAVTDRSIDNFFMALPEHSAPLTTVEGKARFHSMLAILSKKLVKGGTFRILTDLQEGSESFKEILSIASQSGFQSIGVSGKSYFPDSWRDPEFKAGVQPHVLVLALT